MAKSSGNRQWYVQPVRDKKNRSAAWEVYRPDLNKGRGGTYSDHRKKSAALKQARRSASSGEKIRISARDGSVQRWMTVR